MEGGLGFSGDKPRQHRGLRWILDTGSRIKGTALPGHWGRHRKLLE
jgi:hypothetical protein